MATRNTKSKKAETEKEKIVVEAQPKTEKEEVVVEKPKTTKRRDARIPLDVEVPCLCNVKGGLIYTSTRNGGMNAEWSDFGELQYLDVRELLLMRNSQKRFFDDNWISLKDTDDGEYTAEDIYKFLRVDDKYGDFYDADNIETFFDLTEDQMEDKVSKMSRGMKDLVAVMAIDKIEHDEIDSVKKRRAITKVLGLEITSEDE